MFLREVRASGVIRLSAVFGILSELGVFAGGSFLMIFQTSVGEMHWFERVFIFSSCMSVSVISGGSFVLWSMENYFSMVIAKSSAFGSGS